MLSNASSANDPTTYKLQEMSHDHQRLSSSDEESASFLSDHEEKDEVVESKDLKKASFWIIVNIVATVLIVSKLLFTSGALDFNCLTGLHQ